MKKLTVLACFLSLAPLFADSGFLDAVSPFMVSQGSTATTLESPSGIALNPASAADKQRITLDLNYMTLLGLAAETGVGHAANLGIVVPTRFGVFAGMGRFATTPPTFTSTNWGTLGALDITFAKDLFPEFYLGLGVHGIFGGDADSTNWGLGADLGFLYLPGDLGVLKDFRVGFAMRNMGKGYHMPASAPFSLPPAFTPALGVSFAAVKNDTLTLTVSPDFSFPTFQNLRFLLPLELGIADVFFLDAAYHFDLREVLGVDPARTVPFSFGLSFKLKTDFPGTTGFLAENGWNRSEVRPVVSAAPLAGGVLGLAFGVNVPLGAVDRTPPAITIDTGAEKYISPNGDGVKDDMVLPVSLADQRAVNGYAFVVQDAAGNAVRTIRESYERPRSADWESLGAAFLFEKKGITVPQSLRWDGKSDAGTVVADGTYRYYVEAWDDNDNHGRSPLGTVVVDTVAPTAAVNAPYQIFSPNGDGNKDVMILEQTGSVEDLWAGTVQTIAGDNVAVFRWEGSAPGNFQWNGKNDAAGLVPDGVYSYRVAATDRAGNTGSFQLDNLIKNNLETPIRLSVDLSFFSPNGDGNKDAANFSLDVPRVIGIESWSLSIRDRAGAVKRTLTGKGPIAQSVSWDGRDDGGAILPEGAYKALVSIVYVNGNQPSVESPSIVLDLTPPAATVKAEPPLISPDGDGVKDTVTLTQQTSEEVFWTGILTGTGEREVKTWIWRPKVDPITLWDGRGDDGNPVPDGTYTYVLSSTDRAGNPGASAPLPITVDTRPTPLKIATDIPSFSPNGDGVKDAIRIVPALGLAEGIESWSYRIRGAGGDATRTVSGRDRAPEALLWDGRDDAGRLAIDGPYYAELQIVYAKGNQPKANSNVFTIDTAAPSISVRADASLFSPDGDGSLDSVTFFQSSSDEDLWEGEIRDAAGTAVRTYSWKGKALDAVWDGRGDDGRLVPDGAFSYAVRSTDKAGNSMRSSPVRIATDTRATPVRVSTDRTWFSPNGDGKNDMLKLIPALKETEGVASYAYRIKTAAGAVVKTFPGRSAPTETAWDGKNEAGRLAPDGAYAAELEVTYAAGQNSRAASNPFWIDTVAPSVQARASIGLFSPDGDGRLDTVTVSQSSSEEDLWEGEIRGASGQKTFSRFWQGKVADFVWDGRTDEGTQAPDEAYTYTVRATDKAGNSGQSTPLAITMDTRATPVRVTADLSWFSPNGDGVKDALKITPVLGLPTGIESFTWRIRSASGAAVKTVAGSGRAPAEITWDGKDDQGRAAPDGAYTAELELSYAKGNQPKAASAPFSIDSVFPTVTLRPDVTLFSPDGDGRIDFLTITQDTSEEDYWEADLRNARGEKVRGWYWKGRASNLIWDGKDENGNLLPDGLYAYAIKAADKAGNAVTRGVPDLALDTRATPVFVSVGSDAFSPNGDGVKETIRIVPNLTVPTGIESYVWRIKAASGMTVKTVTAGGRAPAEFAWDGRDDMGRAVPDGSYRAELEVSYAKGNKPRDASTPFLLDTVHPTVTLSPDATLFSPDGDGRLDAVTVAQTSSEEDLWEAEMRGAGGDKVRVWAWKGRLSNLIWDGRDEGGRVLPDGTYSYTVRGTDKAGNAASRTIAALTVDTRAASVSVTAGSDGFSPNGDGNRDTMEFGLGVTLTDGIKAWKLSMVNVGSGVQKAFTGDGSSLPRSQTWDGTGAAGKTAPDGSYTAVFQVEYFKGNQPEARTAPFLLNASGPKAEISLTPTPFSPDGDGVDDELTISLRTSGGSPLETWDLTVLDPMGHLFSKFSGRGTPAEKLIWDGLSDKGELVQAAEDYPMVLTLKDAMGNTSITKAVIAVDVLVIRDGERLKVRISSITFAPDKADYTGAEVEADKADKNIKTIKRLAEIFKKYPRYRIRIEGHAVSVYWDNPRQAATEQEKELIPLSKQRADSIKAALVKEGIDASRITTEGIGGAQPIVPHGDLDNRWKNRRVEFILVRE